MKKIVVILIMGFLFIGLDVFAGDGDLKINGSIGIGTDPNSKYGIYQNKDYTDPATGTSSIYLFGYPTYTGEETAAESFYGIRTYARPIINTNHTNSGSIEGGYTQVFRNSHGASADDNGTLTSLYGGFFTYGHYNTNANATPQTTNVYGLYLSPYYKTGNITNLYDIYIGSGSSGGTVTNRYAIYQASTEAENYFAGNVGIGTTSPDYKLDVDGEIRASSGTVIYKVNSYCSNGGGAGFSSTCSTVICGGDYNPLYYTCSGSCSAGSPQSCTNTLMGRLVAP